MPASPTPRALGPEITLYSAGPDGHRGEYATVLAAVFGSRTLCRSTKDLASVVRPGCRRPFFEMLDDNALAFLAAAVLRGLIGRRTTGLFFRAGECFRPGWKYVVKRALFRMASRWPSVTIVTILPFDVDPRFREVASRWIYDPQLWDLNLFGMPPFDGFEHLTRQIRAAAKGRRVLLALGGQDEIKGFPYLVRLWCEQPGFRDSHLVVVGGKIVPACREDGQRLEAAGGFLLDRRLSNEELRHLYRTADLVWCCYAPHYDQASGIFGRAVQLGVPVVVRRGSYIETLGSHLAQPAVSIPFDDSARAVGAIEAATFARPSQRELDEKVAMMSRVSTETLLRSVGLETDHQDQKTPMLEALASQQR